MDELDVRENNALKILNVVQSPRQVFSANRFSSARTKQVRLVTPKCDNRKKSGKKLMNSPYRTSIQKTMNKNKRNLVAQEIPHLYSWSSNSKENKFRLIRPLILIHPSIQQSVHLYGICDGEYKESVSLIPAYFSDIIYKASSISVAPKYSLAQLYKQTLAELRKTNDVLVSHEIVLLLLVRNHVFSLVSGNCRAVLGRKTVKGWSAEELLGDFKISLNYKIIVICNSALLKVLCYDEIIEIAGKYWKEQNPNIASWEIIDKARMAECPICLVIYLS